jgi:uncharacterized membrane protein (DUF485 family)
MSLSMTATEHEPIQKRAEFEDSYKIFLRKRNGHACMMSIVFIVLFPLAAISLHLPLRGVRVVPFIHAPIQILGLAMMIGAMGLGIDIAKNDLHYLSPVKSHVAIGLLTTSMIIFFQPALGLLQHYRFKKTKRTTIFGYAHRWIGRLAIILGWINTGLGFQLVPFELVATRTLVREYVILGVLGSIWFFLVLFDGLRSHWLKKKKVSSFSLGWERGLTFKEAEREKEAMAAPTGDNPAPYIASTQR